MRRLALAGLILVFLATLALTNAEQARADTVFIVKQPAAGRLVFKVKDLRRAHTFRVFIDSDLDPATGFQIGGIGANYLIENDRVYWFTGGGASTDWLMWRYRGPAAFETRPHMTKSSLNLGLVSMHCAFGFDALFWVDQMSVGGIVTSGALRQPPVACQGPLTPTMTNSRTMTPEFRGQGQFQPLATLPPPLAATPTLSAGDSQ
jgi:hypothetical protein